MPRYLRWLQEQQFDYPAHQIALQEMVEAVRVARGRVDRLERTIEEFVSAWSLEPLVRALQTLRGIDLIVSVTFATELGDVSRGVGRATSSSETDIRSYGTNRGGRPSWSDQARRRIGGGIRVDQTKCQTPRPDDEDACLG
ncbi:protein of unknown function [Bradyrhizobium vignae]|uniref:Transposase n=1 Tax=Bradyrhizobium vignae TaxID=1549949 RepID=A0A2U3QA74_9BRAD|nr:protein of unknown function [Bradyrhizobium vignae]